jgi:hypothetical protein
MEGNLETWKVWRISIVYDNIKENIKTIKNILIPLRCIFIQRIPAKPKPKGMKRNIFSNISLV